MNNKDNILVASSSPDTLIHISQALESLKRTIGHGSTEDYAANIEMIKQAVDFEASRAANSSSPKELLIRPDTSDTLIAVQNVIFALSAGFDGLHKSSMFESQEKRSFAGVTYILDFVSEALEFEIKKHGGHARKA